MTSAEATEGETGECGVAELWDAQILLSKNRIAAEIGKLTSDNPGGGTSSEGRHVGCALITEMSLTVRASTRHKMKPRRLVTVEIMKTRGRRRYRELTE